ncbi:MAG: hypothetical protein ACOX3U_04840 [Christensenellales bacterium]|jgi:uncharacterized membrane protein
MNEIRNKFIDELADQLEENNIPDSEIVLADYIALYDEKINKGMTDMEVIIAIGDPKDIVKSLKQPVPPSKKEEALKENLKETVQELISQDKQKGKAEPAPKPPKNTEAGEAQKAASKPKAAVMPKDAHKKKTSEDKKANSPKAAKKGKKRILGRIILFILIFLFRILSPLCVIYAGMNMLLSTPMKDRIIMSAIALGAGIALMIINHFFKKIAKQIVIQSQ